MSRTITVVTPENIQVIYELAGFASRFMALMIDLLIQIVAILLVLGALRLFADVTLPLGGGFTGFIGALAYIGPYVLFFVYATFFEMLWGGRTPGKRLLGLRVIRDGGYPINIIASAIRNILRFVDFGIVPPVLILCGLPGLLCIFFSPNYKRIGDYAAGTLVIVEAGATPFGTRRQDTALTNHVAAYLSLVKNVDRLTPGDYRVIRRFTARRGELDVIVQASLGERLARPLMQKLEIDTPITYQLQYADLLEAMERRYAEDRGVL